MLVEHEKTQTTSLRADGSSMNTAVYYVYMPPRSGCNSYLDTKNGTIFEVFTGIRPECA